MIVIAKIFYTLFFIWIGYVFLRYRKQVRWWTGNFVWAEEYLWRWGTYFIITLIWLACIFYWAMYPFWGLDLIVSK